MQSDPILTLGFVVVGGWLGMLLLVSVGGVLASLPGLWKRRRDSRGTECRNSRMTSTSVSV
jgi:hypothetical protein